VNQHAKLISLFEAGGLLAQPTSNPDILRVRVPSTWDPLVYVYAGESGCGIFDKAGKCSTLSASWGQGWREKLVKAVEEELEACERGR